MSTSQPALASDAASYQETQAAWLDRKTGRSFTGPAIAERIDLLISNASI